MIFQHYLWDFDGTLFNSYPHMTKSMQNALREYNIEASYEEVIHWIKYSVTIAADHYQEQYQLDDLIMDKYRRYEAQDDFSSVVPYDQADKICRQIQARGGFNYLYTHRDKVSALKYLRYFGMEDCFRDFITHDDGFPSKPAADAIVYLTEKFRLEKDRTIMVGDRDIDVQAGENAGISGCLFDPENFYSDFKTRYTVHSMREFAEVFLVGHIIVD